MTLQGKRVVVLVDDLYNEFEFWIPYYRLLEAGAEVLVAGPARGGVYHGKNGLEAKAAYAFADIDPASVNGVVVPGGYAPDRIRQHKAALDLVRALDQAGKAVAFICHAGWVPTSAGIVKGRKVTSFKGIRDDLVNAGAQWVDEPLVVDGNLISSRTPDDLPVFMPAVIAAVARS
jgi:protease I